MVDAIRDEAPSAAITAAFLNLGAGNIILPAPRPEHHALVDEVIYKGQQWVNVDRNLAEGIDEVVDLFRYPWPWADNQFGGALLSHICEHIPHATNNAMQDGWFAFFSELHRVLQPGAIVHCLFPHGRSDGAMTDPTHTRYLTENTFAHSMQPDPNAPFDYARDLHFEMVGPPRFALHERLAHLLAVEGDSDDLLAAKSRELQHKLLSENNVAVDVMVKLRTVK